MLVHPPPSLLRVRLGHLTMSSVLIFGNFAVGVAQRVQSTTSNSNTQTQHFHYPSVINGSKTHVPCILRMWVRPGASAVPSGTVLFVVGKLHAAPGEPAMIDVFDMQPFLGNPDSDEYEDSIIAFNNPWVVVVGTAAGDVVTHSNDSRTFTVKASEFVLNANHTASYLCVQHRVPFHDI